MNLGKVVAKFCDVTFKDAFGTASFMGNIDPFRDATRSSSNTERRVLSTVPGTVIPSRRVITTKGSFFVVADAEHDFYKDAPIRTKYPLMPVVSQFTVRSVAELVNGSPGVADIYGALETSNFMSIKQDSSNMVLKTALVVSQTEDVLVDSVVSVGSRFYRSIADSFVDGVGFRVCELLDLGTASVKAVTVTVKTGRDLVAETDTVVTTAGVPALVVLSQLYYKFSSEDMKALSPGDTSYWVSKTVVTHKPVEGSVIDGRKVVACKENPAGVWELRTHL